MIRVREIDHVVIRAHDLDLLVRFYRDVLGCPVERRQDAIGLVQLRAGRSLIDLVEASGTLGRKSGGLPVAQGRNMDHLCLRIDPFDADSIRAHFLEHGIDVGPAGQRYGAEGEGPSFYVSDPEGNVVELKGPPNRAAAAANE
ncbi:MAG TPA: VOC family protein [Rhodanobacteraceae bacterium]|jgi:catechol 2,3-dioxygenase-like lactoylglutathione lyase family enzyme|nr:VOC family protein [Rhodanobacteraceae bacterium]